MGGTVGRAVRDVPPGLADYLGRQRWFAGRARPWRVQGVRSLGRLVDGPAVELWLVDVAETGADREDGSAAAVTYSLPVVLHESERQDLAHAALGTVGGQWVYDALLDRTLSALWPQAMVDSRTVDGVVFSAEPDAVVARGLPHGHDATVLTGEQSNTSLVYGTEAILKAYRRPTPGMNPDVEVHEALARVGSDLVAAPLGHAESPVGTLFFLQEFVAGAAGGWELAQASLRDLFQEADLHPADCGGDFAAEAERIGATTARLHAQLAASLPTGRLEATGLAERAAAMHRRLDEAVADVPSLGPYRPGLAAALDAVAALPAPQPVQRVHGDLHLGQLLRAAAGWRVLDFEGEPGMPAEERRAPDLAMRDLAGLVRSIDYAAGVARLDDPEDRVRAYRAAEWAARNRDALLDGYTAVAGVDPRTDPQQAVLLRALEVDKAVYEVRYEARMRPDWVSVPLASVARLAEEAA